MKKIFTLVCLGISAGFLAQSFSIYKTTAGGVVTATLANGGGWQETTTVGGPELESHVTLKNNAAVTQSFGVVRTVVAQNPALILDGSTNNPRTYFCFGNNCFLSNVSTVDANNYTILAASGHTNTTFPYADNSRDNQQTFVLYFDEGTTQGTYLVQYKVYNINDPNDTLVYRVGYNRSITVGIKSQTKAADLITDIYPNPANSSSKIFFNLSKDEDLKFQVYNNLGSLVYSSSKQHFSAGKNQMPVDDADLNSGVYFVTITGNSATTTKRLLITK